MPPSLATLLTFSFIFVLFRRDFHRQGEVSAALWLPVSWMTITTTRFVSQWINLGSGQSVSMAEGSPVDALYFSILIMAGMRILALRRVVVGDILRNNPWMAAFFIYSFLAIAWSDFPFVAFKRYIKILGHPVMALIILSDPDPVNAFRTVMKRCAYIIMPLSVLLIKYYPQYGRGFDAWVGGATNNGAMLTKSELGLGCMLFGLFFLWNLLTARRIEDSRIRREELLLSTGFLCIIGWLLHMAQSSTSLVTLLIGAATISMIGMPIINKRFIGTYVVVAGLVAVWAEFTFDVYDTVVKLLGKNPTLTDRTEVWEDCLALASHPLFGEGFESFWLGERLDILWAKWWWQPNQAHNGYIETYLNTGIIGVFLLVGLLISTFRKIRIDLLSDFDFARLRLAFLFAIIFYNYTEATFKGVSIVWTVFHIIAIEYPRPLKTRTEQVVQHQRRFRYSQFRYKKTS